MLTTERLNRIKFKLDKTIDDRMIVLLHEHSGAMPFVQLCSELGLAKKDVRLNIRKSFYVDVVENNVVKLFRRGKESKAVYAIPESATNIHDFVFSILVENFGYTYKSSLDRVLRFCEARHIRSEGYVRNPNIFSTVKKEVKKYLISKGEME